MTVPEMAELAEGHGRVVVDVVDGPTQVMRIATESVVVGMDKDRPILASSQSTEPLCVTPCAVDLPIGRHVLAFPTQGPGGMIEMDHVDVQAHPTVYRRALGRIEPAGAGMILGILGATFGGMSMITGIVLLPVGLANDKDGMTLAGGITLGVGAALVALGVLGIVGDPRTEQPGNAIQFDL